MHDVDHRNGMDLQDRVAFVTGSARRLGREIALALAKAGADIAIHHFESTDAPQQTAEELREIGVQAKVFKADLRDPGEIERLFTDVEAAFHRLDVLVNSAATFEYKPVLEITPEDWDRVLDLNLRAAFFCSQRAASAMTRVGGGSIVNLADVAAFQPWPGYATHSISKAGLVMMTRVLARGLAPDIRVNAVAPGTVLPPDDTDPKERDRLAKMTALGRLGTPEDVTRAVLFLIDSDYITGETINVDGGKALRG
jgi:pteridine reductase